MPKHPKITPELLKKLVAPIAEQVAKKNQAYGSSYYLITDFIVAVTQSMTPKEVVAALPRIISVVRIMDKICRIIHQPTAFGESPWNDKLGYVLLALAEEQFQTRPVQKKKKPNKKSSKEKIGFETS